MTFHPTYDIIIISYVGGSSFMSIIHQYDNRVGVTYVYNVEDTYDNATGQTRSRRKLIGKLDQETNEVIPTGKRGRPRKSSPGHDEDTDPSRMEEEWKTRFLAEMQKKDDVIAALIKENNRLKGELDKAENTISSIRTLCSAAQASGSRDTTG